MSNQEEQKSQGAPAETPLMEKQEAKAIMYIIPVVIIMALIAYIFKDIF